MSMMFFFSELLSFLLIKIKWKKILELNSKLKSYRKLNFVNKYSIYESLLIVIIVWFLSTIFLHHVIDIKIENLMIKFGISRHNKIFIIIITTLYSHFWKLLFHLIYHEMNNYYSLIVEDFANEMKRKLTFPDINAIQMTYRIVIDFMYFQTDLAENVGFIKPFIIFNTIYVNIFNMIGIFSAEIFPEKTLSCVLSSCFATIITAHNFWILYKANNRKKIEKKLEFHLKRWQKIRFSDECIIELEILERTIGQFLTNR